MDMLKGGVGLSGFAEKDPRIVYKKEGYDYFLQMMAGVRDKVTDLIFRARVVGQAQARNAYRETAAVHEEAGGYGVAENLATHGGSRRRPPNTPQAAKQAQGEAAKVKTIVREVAEGRPQRSVPLRQREEVQEVPRDQHMIVSRQAECSTRRASPQRLSRS